MNRSYKNTTIAILLACILTMAIGYAVLNTRLNISGTSNITSNFNIQIVDNREASTSGLAETANVSFTPTSASFSTNLQAPGDEAIYEITVENKGNVNAFISYDDVTFEFIENDYVSLGVYYITTAPMNFNDYTEASEMNSYQLVKPGQKLYVYVGAYFDYYVEDMPTQKDFSFNVNINFHGEGYFGSDIVFGEDFSDAILANEPIVTSGTGLYKIEVLDDNDETYNRYIFKSDGNDAVNNYVSIDGKLWRIIYYDETNGYDSYFIIEDELTNNRTTYGFSEYDDDGFYNSFNTSTLLIDMWDLTYDFPRFFGTFLDNNVVDTRFDGYIENTKVFNADYSYTRDLINISDIMNTSSLSTCKISNLSTGGCKSWLTTNGNTYLYNKVYSDETTNTGNIAYLQNNNVISVDPRDTNYGEYKMAQAISSRCDFDIVFSNTKADGSRNNPYVLFTEQYTWCMLYG